MVVTLDLPCRNRKEDEPISNLMLLTPTEGSRTRGRSTKNYIGVLKEDTEIDIEKLRNVLEHDKCS